MIDLVFRCFSRARWIIVATARGIYNAAGVVQPGFTVDEVGTVVLTPAVMDNKTVITPAVMDTWFWVNLRITGTKFTDDQGTLYTGENAPQMGDIAPRFIKSKLAAFVRNQASPIIFVYKGVNVRTYQFGATTNRVQLIDPRDYSTIRHREWLGGMQF